MSKYTWKNIENSTIAQNRWEIRAEDFIVEVHNIDLALKFDRSNFYFVCNDVGIESERLESSDIELAKIDAIRTIQSRVQLALETFERIFETDPLPISENAPWQSTSFRVKELGLTVLLSLVHPYFHIQCWECGFERVCLNTSDAQEAQSAASRLIHVRLLELSKIVEQLPRAETY